MVRLVTDGVLQPREVLAASSPDTRTGLTHSCAMPCCWVPKAQAWDSTALL